MSLPVGGKSCRKTHRKPTGSNEDSLPLSIPSYGTRDQKMRLPHLFLPSSFSPRQGSSHLCFLGFGGLCLPGQLNLRVAKVRVGEGERRTEDSACVAQWGGDREAMVGRAQSTQGWGRGKAKDARSRARDRWRPRDPAPGQPRRDGRRR